MSKARGLADLGNAYSDGALSNRNLIINGAMQVAQRGTSFTAPSNGAYCLDRFSITHITDGVADVHQASDGPTSTTNGVTLTNSMHVDVTTADTSVSASNMYAILQGIEQLNISHVGFGQSGTRYVTASFWVKSTKTGTFCCFIKASDHTRAYTKEYTVSASNTWEHKTLTFPVDTSGSGSWGYVNIGAQLGWTLYGGTNYHITADTWTATTSNFAPCTANQVNAFDSASNDFKITGVQLEVGDTATPFEHRSFGDELQRCQRYYKDYPAQSMNYHGFRYNGSISLAEVHFPVAMRTAPTIAQSGAGTATSITPSVDGFTVAFNDTDNNFINTYTADAEL